MAKRIHHLIPCAPYDIQGVQQFLEDMALHGWILQRQPLFAGFAVFEKGEPQSIRYRLAPSMDGKEPGQELLYTREMGWEYRLLWGEFHIYACSDPDAPELSTDPQVMAIAMGPLVRRRIYGLFLSLVMPLIVPIWNGFWGMLLHENGWAIALILLAMALNLLGSIRNLVRCLSIRRQLRAGEALPPTPDYRRKLWQYYFSFTTGRLWGYGYLAALIYLIAALFFGGSTMDFADYQGTLPFPTMAEFLPETTEAYLIDSESRTVSDWESWLSEKNYEYYEGYVLTLSDSTLVTGTQWVLYHEAPGEDYARLLWQEKRRELERKNYDTSTELSIDGLDECILYSDRSAAMVIRHGNTVVFVSFSMRYIENESQYCADALERFAQVYASGLEG